ncbi:LPXTG cell wall anchor domain-containing protein [Stackebrandtia nassauensis]|uniref:LPXTG-motif cell wall anchor domain protein n=1 Tax=Stackebrandtia nassauensis (strain DSM 44728 / CIP 108903 / NRRL B-16338 / NBRC 102104 / LLR-40K-21) TaxID=446470 RepID=D3Q449_STANL|nr:LPXTG cell wall anchor domain-containing protein [Stackebrandtia nassauensis]ADD45934.1 LPXTG-motif cell wall anchor domain protein [Stackebrandtia nassauensis DSM 44728]
MRGICLVVGAVLVFVGTATPVAAAPVTVDVCDPASAQAKGDPTSVTLPDDGVFARGKAVALQVNDGRVVDPEDRFAYGHVPVCAILPTEDGRPEPRAEWMFCLERTKYACEDEPEYGQVDAHQFSARDRARLAWVFRDATLTTPTERAEAQSRVWCVSDKLPSRAVNTDAVEYYEKRDLTITGTCPDWDALDPTLPEDPQLDLHAVKETVKIGGTARFELTSTADPVTVTATGGKLSVCPDSGNGELDGDTLRLDTDKPVQLCVKRDRPGKVSVSAERHGIASADMEFWQYTSDPRNCQVLLRGESAPSSLHASAAARFEDNPKPSPTSSASADGDDDLPSTGTSLTWPTLLALAAMAAGIAAIVIARRMPRQPRL